MLPPMAIQPEFIRRQYEFAAHIRDPEHAPAPGDVEDRRMAIYRELFYNNVEGFLSNTFPVLRELTDTAHWHALVRDFFAHHQSHSPLFLEIPREFLSWLREERTPQEHDFPFLYELAHYEWTELALSVAEEKHDSGVGVGTDPGDAVPVLSPLAWHLSYRYPVHRISSEYIPEAPPAQPTFLVVYRNPADEVGFLEINAVTKRLLELIETASGATGRELLTRIATELSHPQPEVVINGGNEILAGLRDKSIISYTDR